MREIRQYGSVPGDRRAFGDAVVYGDTLFYKEARSPAGLLRHAAEFFPLAACSMTDNGQACAGINRHEGENARVLR